MRLRWRGVWQDYAARITPIAYGSERATHFGQPTLNAVSKPFCHSEGGWLC